MKKHRSFFVGIIIMIAACTLSAQNNNEALKTLAKSAKSHKNLEVSFTYQVVGDPEQAEEAKEGKAYFMDGAYKIIMDEQQAISDGTTTWHYIVDEEEVMVGNATEGDNPYSILDDLEKDDSGATPIFGKNGNLKGIELEIDEGIKMVLNIIEMKFDQKFGKEIFTFDEKAYPDVEIIDMR